MLSPLVTIRNTPGRYVLEVDWNNDGDYADTGEDISADVISIETFTGRDFPAQLTGRAVVGQLTAVLQNLSGKYNSFNTSSPISGNILPKRTVRLRATDPLATTLWTGFLESITPSFDVARNRTAILRAYGPLGALDTEVRVPMRASTRTDVAIGTILDQANWSTAARDLDAGKTTMTRWWADGLKALSAAREVEATEAGFLRETRSGSIRFEDRQRRLSGTYTTAQATYSDSATGAIVYSEIQQQDPWPLIFNHFTAEVRLFGTATSTVLWTHAEANGSGSAPEFVRQQTRVYFATYPNPTATLNAVGVDAWTAPTSTTDYQMFSDTAGTGTELTANFTISITTFATAAKIEMQNTGTRTAYLTKLQLRGVPVTQSDPIQVEAIDASSTSKYGLRRYPRPDEARWTPTSQEAQDWANYHLGVYKDPQPLVTVTINGGRSLANLDEAISREVSDRVRVQASGTFLQLGIARDFYVEAVHHSIGMDRYHICRVDLSPSDGFDGYWVLDTSALGSSTRPAYAIAGMLLAAGAALTSLPHLVFSAMRIFV